MLRRLLGLESPSALPDLFGEYQKMYEELHIKFLEQRERIGELETELGEMEQDAEARIEEIARTHADAERMELERDDYIVRENLGRGRIAELEAGNERLREAAQAGLAEARAWLQEGQCDCTFDGGTHTCGEPRLRRSIDKIERALAELEGGDE